MASSDTAIGVAGLVLLVAVMVGVFVYEYNNAPVVEDNDTGPVAATFSDDFRGSLGAHFEGATSPAFEYDFVLAHDTAHLYANVTYSVMAPAPAPPTPAFQVSLLDGAGEAVQTGSGTQSGTTVDVSIEVIEPLPAGDYTVFITQAGVGPGGAFEGDVWAAYDASSE